MRNIEASIQKAVISWCRNHDNPLYHEIFHVPNGEKRDKITAFKLKRQGVVAGVSDLCLPLPGGKTLWIELKTQKGRLSVMQKKLIARWAEIGHIVKVAYGYTECIELLEGVVR